VELRPLPATRIANTCPGLGLMALGTALTVDGSLGAWHLPAGLGLVPAGAALALRGYRLRVQYDDQRLTVHGLLRSRRIPITAVEHVDDWPAVQWRTARGRSRWTPLLAFGHPGAFARVRRHNRAAVHQLRQWIRRPSR
jgi:hypothetical protein